VIDFWTSRIGKTVLLIALAALVFAVTHGCGL
jgi:hypothetical protein